ncbi:MAG: ATP-binding protein [Promethearchaeota archaeon]
MAWIVIGEDKGKIKLVSKKEKKGERPGLLPKGSYLTVEPDETNSKFILRVDNSLQYEPYSPSPMIIDMDLQGLYGDKKCQNIIYAYRVKDLSDRKDGKIDFIPPQSLARRSTQEEVDIAMGSKKDGPKVFLSTVHAGQNQLLVDDNLNFITTKLPKNIFFHQMQICGKTGSGKTVATKYLAQYFVEEMEGAVLAINVKDIDFLMMDKPSVTKNKDVINEWKSLKKNPKGVDNYIIYYPANIKIESLKGVNLDICQKITLDVNKIEPESLTGLLQNISDVGAQNFPDIFRYWQQRVMQKGDTFYSFVNYFQEGQTNPIFDTLNSRGDESSIPIHRGTYDNILRNLNSVVGFFDNEEAKSIDFSDILYPGKLSVINVAGEKGIQFGSILLRHLLKRIVQAKSQGISEVKILIIIDEVHQFYNTESSKEALGDLDTICRTGRSQQIGVIFSSQNQSDIPKGLSSVVNTKIFFKSDGISGNLFGISGDEIQSLKSGYAIANIHDLSQLRTLKFPLSYSGVFEEED